MAKYGRNVLKRHAKVLTASSDIGEFVTSIMRLISVLTYVGNVSYILPTLHTTFGTPAEDGSYPHHPSFASAAGTDDAHEEAIIVGKSLALIGWNMVTNGNLFERAMKQWQEAVRE